MRYIGEVRFRLVGAPTPEEKAAAQSYFSYGRKLLGIIENRDIALGLLPNTSQQDKLSDGTIVTAAISFGVAVVTVDVTKRQVDTDEPVRGPLNLDLRWEPEGMLLTPVTADEPGGWGLPRRSMEPDGAKIINELPLGTPGGYLPQVLLNRFSNNKYHDDPRVLSGGDIDFPSLIPEAPDGEDEWVPDVTRFSYATENIGTPQMAHTYWRKSDQFTAYSNTDEEDINGTYILANPGYVAYSIAGVRDSTQPAAAPLLTQKQVIELETTEWYVHRPEEILATDETRELVWYKANLEREKVGESRIGRPLRGEQNVSDFSIKNMVDSSLDVFSHSYFGWTPGMRTASGRVQSANGWNIFGAFYDNGNENLQLLGPEILEGLTPEESAEVIVQGWVNSPFHYAAMISEQWSQYYLPTNQYTPGFETGADAIGSINATSAIGTNAGLITVTKLWDKEGGPGSFDIIDVDPPVQGFGWAQTWDTRPAWLPVCATTETYALGTTGLFGSTCPYNRNHYRANRQFVFNSSVYEIPQGNELPGFIAIGDPQQAIEQGDEFMTCLGCAPYEKIISPPEEGAADIKQVWLRGVYWKSKTAIYTYTWGLDWSTGFPMVVSDPDSVPPPTKGEGELVVLVWPEGLAESPILPWDEDDGPKGYEVEFRQTFTTTDNWVPESEGLVRFNSTGTKFIIELERADSEKMKEGVTYTYEERFKQIELLYPFLSVQRVAMVYENKALTELYQNQGIEAVVDSRYLPEEPNDGSRVVRYLHNVVVNGEYKIYPHFDAEDNVQYCRLLIDEQFLQQPPEQDAGFDYRFSPFDPKIDEFTNCKGYRRRVLVFPSGKEFVYMQQYMIQNFCVGWTGAERPPGYDYFPGDGENFYCVIQELDERAERVIYGKHTSYTYYNYENLDPLGNDIPWYDKGYYPPGTAGKPEPNNYYWTRGDSTYHLDMGFGADRVQELLASYPGTQDIPIARFQQMDYDSTGTNFSDAVYMYNPGTTPYQFNVTVVTRSGQVVRRTTPKNITFGWSQRGAVYTGRGEESTAVDDFFTVRPTKSYNVTVSGRRDQNGVSNTSGVIRYYGSGQNSRYGQGSNGTSGVAYHNVAPMYSNDVDARAKFVSYKDRWVCRLEIRNIDRGGGLIDDDAIQGFRGNYPQDGVPNTPDSNFDQSFRGLDGLTGPSGTVTDGSEGQTDKRTAVHLKANFDLDEATGVDGIIDIYPFGKI